MAGKFLFYRSTVGKKIVMAVTGALLFLFLVGHMVGNLQIFLGAEQLNAYAHFLKSVGELLWIVRGVMLVALGLHMLAALQVFLANWKARPQGYAKRCMQETTYAARTMIYSGPLLLLYLVYHLLMYTFLVTGPGLDPVDVYRNVVLSFQVYAISGIYIAAMLVLGFHLYHAVWSMLQTLGINQPKINPLLRPVSAVVGIVIAAGFISIPVAVLAGIVA